MKQQTFATAADQNLLYERYRRSTRRDAFLATMRHTLVSACLWSRMRLLPISARALQVQCLFLVLALSSGCNSSGSAAEQVEASESCQWLTPEVAGESCGADPWSELAAWRVSQPRVDAAYLNFIGSSNPVQTAAIQTERGFQARPDVPYWPLALPLNWNADPFKDRNWRFQLHAWRMIDPLVFAWLETGEKQYIELAFSIIDDWRLFHVERAASSAYGWYDMSVGIRAMKLAFLIDRGLRGEYELNARRRAVVLELAELHVRKLLEPDFLASGNHGLFQLHGLVALCETVPFLRSCPGALDYAEAQWQKLLSRQFSSEGIHLEHSPSYHLFIADTVRGMLRSGWYENFEQVQQLMRKVEANKIWMLNPDKKVIAIGDSTTTPINLRFPPGDDTCVDASVYQSRCYLLKAFPTSGYAMVRSDWAVATDSSSMLFFMASFHSGLHKHADDLSFELFEFGEPLLTDTGKSSYEYDAWRNFAVSTRAHNALEIDGRSSSTLTDDAYGSALRNAARRRNTFLLDGKVQHAALNVAQRRQIFYTPRLWLLVVDQLTGGAPTTATQWFHFAPSVHVVGPHPGPEGSPIFNARLGNGRQVQVQQLVSSCPGELTLGSSNPIQGWVTESYGSLVPRHTIGFTCSSAPRTLATLFVLDPQRRGQALSEVDEVLRELGLTP